MATDTMAARNSELAWHAATAANILEARKRKGRVGSKKSRNGCIACKTRRVKCDETRPTCSSCIASGRSCEYKATPDTTVNTLGRHLSPFLGLDNRKKRTFDYFLSWTAPRLGGMMDRDFWCGSVLQFAQHERVVLDALLALSTLYEHPQYMKTFLGQPNYAVLRGDQRPPIDEHHVKALHHYNHAIRGFASKMTDGSATPALALLTCILFICIEVIRDDIFAALALMRKGDAVLEQSLKSPQCIEPALFATIKSLFGRLSVLSAQCGVPVGLEKYAVLDDIPTRFHGIDQARTSLFGLMADGHAFLLDAAEFYAALDVKGPLQGASLPYYTSFKTESPEVERGATEPLLQLHAHHESFPLRMHDIVLTRAPTEDWMPADMKERQKLCGDRFQQWYSTFRPTYTAGDEDEGTACLLMYYHISAIFMTARLSPFQTVFDKYTDDFEEVVRLAERYVERKAHERPCFTFELGAVPPLFVVALKCRVPSLRRKAVQLLRRCPGKECTFGAGSCAELAARIVAIEEEGLGLTPPPISPSATPTNCAAHGSHIYDSMMPSENRRIHNFELLANTSAKCFELRVTRYSEDAGGDRVQTVSDHPM